MYKITENFGGHEIAHGVYISKIRTKIEIPVFRGWAEEE